MVKTIFKKTDSFVRPADTSMYISGDLIANSTTAGSVVPLQFDVGYTGAHLVRAVLRKSSTGVTGANFDVRLFESSPTVANGDNGAISHDYSNHFATLAFPTMVAGTDDAYAILNMGEASGVFYVGTIHVEAAQIYALVEADASYTPVSGETFYLELTFDALNA